jgi:energy-coupling factor transport system ATP-binding protein
LEGTPSEVFSHGQELREMGLDTPKITQIFQRLRAMGLDVDDSVYTMEEAKKAILALKQRGRGVC